MTAADDAPFHPGELEVQSRVGVREKISAIGQRVIRDVMPEQHREFFPQLPFILVGALDAAGKPWASMLVGAPGFITSPDPRRLHIAAQPLPGDPLADSLRVGADVGLLGIELHTRRRNRLNGPIISADERGFSVRVAQSFGNCPKYINRRGYQFVERDPRRARARTLDRLDNHARALINNADTFFIATHYGSAERSRSHGADVSHRGGKMGFVRIDDERTLTWPDFVGNYLFNTLGNLQRNPQAGLMFPGFDSGDMLYVSGRGEIVWDGDEVRTYAGAQRLVRFRIERVVHSEATLPLQWQLEEYSPFLEPTGSWSG
jgi:hypothetical protein